MKNSSIKFFSIRWTFEIFRRIFAPPLYKTIQARCETSLYQIDSNYLSNTTKGLENRFKNNNFKQSHALKVAPDHETIPSWARTLTINCQRQKFFSPLKKCSAKKNSRVYWTISYTPMMMPAVFKLNWQQKQLASMVFQLSPLFLACFCVCFSWREVIFCSIWFTWEGNCDRRVQFSDDGTKRWAFWKQKHYDKKVKRVCGLLRARKHQKRVKIDTPSWWKSDFAWYQQMFDVSIRFQKFETEKEWLESKECQLNEITRRKSL